VRGARKVLYTDIHIYRRAVCLSLFHRRLKGMEITANRSNRRAYTRMLMRACMLRVATIGVQKIIGKDPTVFLCVSHRGKKQRRTNVSPQISLVFSCTHARTHSLTQVLRAQSNALALLRVSLSLPLIHDSFSSLYKWRELGGGGFGVRAINGYI